MKVFNVHSRHLDAPPEAVGALLGGLASPGDPIWPEDRWPPMRFDRPLGRGAVGGHGPIPYRVAEIEPGRRIAFELIDRPGLTRGLTGWHWLEVHPDGSGGATLRHVIEGEARGRAAWIWALVIGPLHDALVEDALDRAEGVVTGPPARPARWTPWVRFLRRVLAARRGREGTRR